MATTQTAADKAKAFMRVKDIERQARIAFQTSQVDKEADWEQAHLPKEKRAKRVDKEGFTSTSSEDEDEEPPKKKKKQAKKAKKGGKPKKSDSKKDEEDN